MQNPSRDERVQIVNALSASIQNRWKEAQLEFSAEDVVKAGLAALEFLEAAVDEYSPWDLRDFFDLNESLTSESKPA